MSKHSVNGMCVGTCDRNQFLLTAGSDMRIRYWDLNNASNSQIVVNAATDPVYSSTTVSYRSVFEKYLVSCYYPITNSLIRNP